jgi:hypothetical protein
MPDLAPGEKIVDIPVQPIATTTVIPPVEVTVIGSMKDVVPTTGTVATTPGPHQPNVIVTVITPLVAIFVRFSNTFFISLVGLLTAAMTPAGSHLLYTSDFYHLLITCANLSIPVSGLGLIKDLVTVFGKLEQKYPLATGSI